MSDLDWLEDELGQRPRLPHGFLPVRKRRLPWWAFYAVPLGVVVAIVVAVYLYAPLQSLNPFYSPEQRAAVRWMNENLTDAHYEIVKWSRLWKNSEHRQFSQLSAKIRITTRYGGPELIVEKFFFDADGKIVRVDEPGWFDDKPDDN